MELKAGTDSNPATNQVSMKKKILIADDEPDVVVMLQRLFESNNYRVTTAKDGNECVKRANEYRPDLIFLDIIMPKKDGFRTLAELKNRDATKTRPIVILSARSETSALFEA